MPLNVQPIEIDHGAEVLVVILTWHPASTRAQLAACAEELVSTLESEAPPAVVERIAGLFFERAFKQALAQAPKPKAARIRDLFNALVSFLRRSPCGSASNANKAG